MIQPDMYERDLLLGSKYKSFYGSTGKIFAQALQEGYDPLSYKEIIQRRVEVLEDLSTPTVVETWWRNGFCSTATIVYHPNNKKAKNKKAKILTTRPRIQEEISVDFGALHLQEQTGLEESVRAYEALDGFELDLDTYNSKNSINPKDIDEKADIFLDDEVVAYLLDDKKLHEKYVEAAIKRYEPLFEEDCIERSFLSNTSNNKAVICRAICVSTQPQTIALSVANLLEYNYIAAKKKES